MNLIVKLKFGSHLYGTNTPDSDTDYKGIFLPTIRDILLGKIPKRLKFDTKSGSVSKNNKDDIDSEIYSLHYFIKLALAGETVAIDMLHAPDNMIVDKNYVYIPIWRDLINNKHKFYTKNLKAFVGYARKQAAKYGIKGSRLNAAKIVLDVLNNNRTNGNVLIMNDIWEKLPIGEHLYFTEPDRYNNIFYQVCGKKIGSTVKINYAYDIVEKFYNEYGKRAYMAARNEGIDWKAVSHAIRAAYQVKEIFIEKGITFPLRNADYLIKVKKGELDYNTEVAPHLENLMEEIEELSLESDLPENSDVKFWEDWLVKTLERYLL